MVTTIQVSERLKEELSRRKMFPRESYEDVIWELIEMEKELSEGAEKHIEESYGDIKEGKLHTLEEVKKELGI